MTEENINFDRGTEVTDDPLRTATIEFDRNEPMVGLVGYKNDVNGDISALGFYRYRCGTFTPPTDPTPPDNGGDNEEDKKEDEKDDVDPNSSLDPNTSRDNNEEKDAINKLESENKNL